MDRRLSHPHSPLPPRGGRAARVRRARHRARHDRDGVRRPPAVPRRVAAAPRPHGRLVDGPGRARRLRLARPGTGARVRRRRAHPAGHRGRLHRGDAGRDRGDAGAVPVRVRHRLRPHRRRPLRLRPSGDGASSLAEYGLDRIHLESLELARAAAESGLFDVIGHLDHAKKFGPPARTRRRSRPPRPRRCAPSRRPAWPSSSTPAACASRSARPFPGARRCSPRRALSASRSSFGSDAHRPGDVGCGFDAAAGPRPGGRLRRDPAPLRRRPKRR